MNPRITAYIEQTKVCPDLIFRNPDEFLDLLFECGGCVNEILWFEYILIKKQATSLGSGGWKDPLNPDYMWAETMVLDSELSHLTLSQIKAHIEKIRQDHSPHVLVPCFFDITT